MNFSWFFANKIAWGRASENSLSRIIVRVGQLAVALGVLVALITLSTGIGAKKEIKQKLADFNGHITVTPYNSNLSLNSDTISLPKDFYPDFPVPEVEHIQAVATKSGIIRSENSFDGVLLKGVDTHFDKKRFDKFLVKGHFPEFKKNVLSNDVVVSQKIANHFFLDIDSSFIMVFVNEKKVGAKPVYRKFKVKGIYSTDIEQFDNLYVIGDLRQVQRINGWGEDKVGGFELFVKDVDSDLSAIKEKVNNEIGYKLIAETATDRFQEIEDWVRIFDTNIFIILFIMLFVVIINMVMVLLILILERTHSIGLLKTLGATNAMVRKIFVNYALFIMVPGLVVGNVVALGLLFIQYEWGVIELPPENYYISKAPVFLSWEMVFAVNAGSILVCALALWIPSLLIRRISPSKAMKVQ